MDLAACLQDTDYLCAWLKAPPETHGYDDLPTVIDDLEMLTSSSPQLSAANVYVDHYKLHEAAMRYLGRTIGCIAKAIAWLHTRNST
jgi:hypothetical protein